LEQVTDRWGNRITLTDERWQHIIEWHPELEEFQEEVLETIRRGRRRQDPMDQQKYKYIRRVEGLPRTTERPAREWGMNPVPTPP